MDMMTSLLQQLYSKEQAEEIIGIAPHTPNSDGAQASTWHKNSQMYVAYPFSFCDEHGCGFSQLENKLPYLQQLGVDSIHILPPFESPLIDNGFDISDFLRIRSDIGGNEAFTSFIEKAQAYDMHIFLDLVLNHVSQTHEWFQKALTGDQQYRDYFVWSETKPNYIKNVSKPDGEYAQYIINDTKHDIKIIFPEQVGEIPHWTQAEDGNWYYHTFYPHQVDLNWDNYRVMKEFVAILAYWAEQGMNFRLDAVPYIGKHWHEGMQTSTTRTHAIVQCLRHVLEETYPEGIFLVEANTHLETLINYCGTREHKESDLAYNFQLTEAIWIALIIGNTDFLWETLNETAMIPDWTQWVTFLRNHDELTLRYCTKETHDTLCTMLSESGITFREGHAISGRTASFLQNDPQRITLAHMLLASLPGNPAIVYGDEIGKPNDPTYMKSQYELKRQLDRNQTIQPDSRDINRGYISENEIQDEFGQTIFNAVAQILNTRKNFPTLATTIPALIEAPESVFAAKYQLENQNLEIFLNLSAVETTVATRGSKDVVLSINEAEILNDQIILPAYGGIWLTSHAT